MLRYNRRPGERSGMTDLTRQEQQDGATVIRAWPADERRFVISLPKRERDLVVLCAALFRTAQPTTEEPT